MKKIRFLIYLMICSTSLSVARIAEPAPPPSEPQIVLQKIPPEMLKTTLPKFENGHSARNIPFKLIGNHIVLPIRINDSRELNIVLDTGMPIPEVGIMDEKVAEELNLQYIKGGPEIQIAGAGIGETKTAKLATGAKVSLPGLEFQNQRVSVADFPELPHDGVIGLMIFGTCVVEIDYDKQVIHLYDPDKYAVDQQGSVLELKPLIPGLAPYIEVTASIDGTTSIPLKLAVDLGFSGAIDLYTNPSKGIELPQKVIDGLLGTGLQGDVKGKLGRIHAVNLGRYTLANVICSFPNEKYKMSFIQDFDLDGIIGNRLFKRFNIVLDYAHHRMIFKPNQSFAIPFEDNMAGLTLRSTRTDSMVVYHVQDQSPAALAGIQKDDLLVSINGKAIASYSQDERRRLFRQEGIKLDLVLERATQQLHVSVVLQRMI